MSLPFSPPAYAIHEDATMCAMEDMRLLTTRSGFTFQVRQVREEDEAMLAEFFTHVTRDDLRFRFLSGAPRVTHDQIVMMTHVDHRRTENYLAFAENGSVLVATAMLACDSSMTRAEVAIALREDYKARGIGWELLRYVADAAVARGVSTIESIESRENHAAIDVEEDQGFTAAFVPGDPSVVRVSKTLHPN